MTHLDENAHWEDSIYEIREIDPVLGGTDGISNLQAAQLANRTQWLKARVAEHDDALDTLAGHMDDQHALIRENERRIEAQNALQAAHASAADPHPQYHGQYRAVARGTGDTITADFGIALCDPPLDQTLVFVRASGANTALFPTFATRENPPRAIVKGHNLPLWKGDIAGAGYDMMLQYNANFDRWVLMNPALSGNTGEMVAPVGAMMYWPLPDPPTGWLVRDGAEISRIDFAALFAVIGTRYGAGDGNSTFQLPDDRGNFERGWDQGRGMDEGRGFGSEQEDAIRKIYGNFSSVNYPAFSPNGDLFYGANWSNHRLRGESGTGAYSTLYFDSSRVVPTANENRPRNRAYLPIIKYR